MNLDCIFVLLWLCQRKPLPDLGNEVSRCCLYAHDLLSTDLILNGMVNILLLTMPYLALQCRYFRLLVSLLTLGVLVFFVGVVLVLLQQKGLLKTRASLLALDVSHVPQAAIFLDSLDLVRFIQLLFEVISFIPLQKVFLN